MSLKLYELASEYESLIPLAEAADDEAELQAFYDTLDGLQGEIGAKLEGCAAVIETLERQAEMIRETEKRLAGRRKAMENSVDRLKTYMLNGMKSAQMVKHVGKHHTIAIQKSPPSVAIQNESAIPGDYYRIKREVDRASIKDALTAGREVPGCALQQGESLRIR